ncbi:hypothetical protein ACRARE_14585 [Pseudooceanicola sp. 200-1SW]
MVSAKLFVLPSPPIAIIYAISTLKIEGGCKHQEVEDKMEPWILGLGASGVMLQLVASILLIVKYYYG